MSADKKLPGPNEPGYNGPGGPIGIPTPDSPDLPWQDDSDVPINTDKKHHLGLPHHKTADPVVPATNTASNPVVSQPASESRPAPAAMPKQATASGHKMVIILISILVVAVLAFAAYWFALKPKPAAKSATQTSSTTATQAASAKTIDTATKTYTSANFGLAFNYPADWTITDTTGSNVLTAVSPAVSLKNAANQSVTGQITLKIRNSGQALTEFAKGNATAVLASTKINYTKPTQTQRASTYVSFLQYATTTAAGGLDEIYITGDNGYQVGQAIPEADVAPVDPLISLTFGQCADSKCSGTVTPLTIASSSWSATALSTPLINMLESLSIN